MHEVTFYVCGACACLIANGDASGDAFAPDPEFRGKALDRCLADRSATWPVVACVSDEDEDHVHPWTQQMCDVCGEYAEEVHPILADAVP